ncbi:MAG: N-methyl-L-tryptophan oxidase [Thermomicrobiales bacterium]
MAGHDVIVAGLGGMGAATAYYLASRGHSVLGFDMHEPGHTLGSSHGHHRIIREAYFEDPNYVPFVQRAYGLWAELEEDAGVTDILTITGGLMFGRRDSQVVEGSLMSGRLHGLPYEEFSAREASRQFPGFRLAEDMVAVYEARSGFVAPEKAIAAQVRLARQRDADLRYGVEVTGWSSDGNGVTVETTNGTFSGQSLVLTTGPWANELLSDLQVPLEVWRIVNCYFEPIEPELYEVGKFPIYLFDAPEGTFYGFPHIDGVGLKIGRHDTGRVTTARTIDRTVADSEINELHDVLSTYLPSAAGRVLDSITCMYTMTPDEHFVIDRHPEHANVVLGCGFSGHGYKFASAIGEALGELALGESPSQPIGFLGLQRFNEELAGAS